MQTFNSEPETLIIDENALQGGKKRRQFPVKLFVKGTFVVTIIFIVFEVYVGIKSFSVNTEPTKNPKQAVFQNAQPIGKGATLALLSASEVKVGEKLQVDIKIATFGRSVKNITMVIKYDPLMVDVSSNNFFVNGKVFSVNPVISRNDLTGVVTITGQTGSPQAGYSGVGMLGKMQFNTKKIGNTKVSIDDKSENGSKIIDYFDGKNILGEVYNVDLNIKQP